MKTRLLIAIAILALPLLVPSMAKAINYGSIWQGPIKAGSGVGNLAPGVNPPVGCSYIEGYHVGHYPMVGMTTNYWFHVRYTYCWSASAWVHGEENNASGRYFTRRSTQVWWDHLSDRISYEKDIQVVTRHVAGCTGCLKIRVTGQVHVEAVPYLGFLSRTTHPWVEFTIAPDGSFVGGSFSYAVF